MQQLLSVLVIGAWIFAFIDVMVTDRAAVRTLPKWAWIGLVLVLPAIAPLPWCLFGRPARPPPATATPPHQPAPLRRPRPPTRAQRAEEEADLRASIAERDRIIAQWDEEERRGKTASSDDPG